MKKFGDKKIVGTKINVWEWSGVGWKEMRIPAKNSHLLKGKIESGCIGMRSCM